MKKIETGLGIRTSESYLIEKAYPLFQDGIIDFVEIIINSKNLRKAILDFGKYQIPYTFHGPYESCGVNIANPKKETANIIAIREAIEFAKRLGGKFMILHPGYMENPGCRKEQACKMIKLLSPEFPILLENNPFLGENSEEMFFSTPEEISLLVPFYCGLCLDFTHAYTAAVGLNQKPQELFKEFMQKNPGHFHINGGRIESKIETPMSLRNGNFDLLAVKRLILKSKAKTLTIETPRKSNCSLEENIEDINYFARVK